MEQNLGFKQQLSQQQKLSYQMIQSINLLSIPTIELSEKIYEEVEKNPALEIVRDVSFENAEVRVKSTNNELLAKNTNSSDSRSDNFQAFLENTLYQEETLQEYLLQQLSFSNLSDDEKEIAAKIIQSLDDRGFFITSLEEIFAQNKLEYEKALLVLPKIQKFDPIGVICKNLQESLEIQAKEKLFSLEKDETNFAQNIDTETKNLILQILHSNFELLEKTRPSYVHKKLNEKGISCTLSQVELSIDFIRSLDPYPAREFFVESSVFIGPDVLVRQLSEEELREENNDASENNLFIVELVKTNLPVVKISKDFLEYQNENSQTKKAVKDAKNFLNAVEQRNSTLLKVSVEIVKYQKDFFEKGSLYLKPLRLKDIANKIGVHETTVSRISNGKYLQCEWGLFELKYFFSNSVNENNDSQSKESIKQELLQILKSSGEKKLSDQKLSEKLAEKGINIARRTVAKYRKELNFDSSYDR